MWFLSGLLYTFNLNFDLITLNIFLCIFNLSLLNVDIPQIYISHGPGKRIFKDYFSHEMFNLLINEMFYCYSTRFSKRIVWSLRMEQDPSTVNSTKQ